MATHRFRFFLDATGAVGDEVELCAEDARHLRVIRAAPGVQVEAVDARGALFDAVVTGASSVELVALRREGPDDVPPVVLYAGVLAGNRWDALLDGAVQAGATRIVPLAQSSRELMQVERRAARARRVIEAAAKQSKRIVLPEVAEAIRYAELVDVAPGVVLDERTDRALIDLLAAHGQASGELAVVVGAASGLPLALVRELSDAGWQLGSLGPTVLRSELAAAVGVSIAVQSQLAAASRG